MDREYWKDYLNNSDDKLDDMLRRKTHKGKAFANEEIITQWEKNLNCILRELKPGPDRKKN